MSRVRILNLPNDCTEKELREHFTRNAPPTAPPLEVTDVMIKRLPPSATATSSAAARNGRQRGGRFGGNGGSSALTTPLGKIRMAFVGFKSAAAGRFVIGHFNNSYFRSSKIRVEQAKGLNEVGVTLNMRKKQERQQQLEEEARAKAGEGVGEGEGAAGGVVKRRRDADGAEEHNSADGGAVGGETDGDGGNSRQKTRREMFIEERTKATEGPSWAAEVLLPQAGPSSGAAGDGAAAVAADPTADGGDGDAEDEEELELRALEKQQALGAVSDLDFLSAIGGGGGGGGGDAGDKKNGDGDDGSEGRGDALDAGEEEGTGATVGGESGDGPNPPPSSTKRRIGGADEEEEESPEEIARASRRVRIGNIPYTATEENVKQFVSSLVGHVEAVHIPLTKDTRQSKGAAFIRFVDAEDAVRALTLCRGAILMGRLLRVSAAAEDPHSKAALDRDATQATQAGSGSLAGSSGFKIDKERERRGEAAAAGGGGHVSWNTMYMSSSAAVDQVAQRLGVKSEDLVSVQAGGAAVRAAIAEAYLTSEIQQVLSDEGVAFDVLESGQQSLLKPRSNTTILVKNLQLGGPAEATELSKMFLKFGALETSVFPSSGTFALFRYMHPQDARTAFTRLAYKLFKNMPLFLEWAPVGAIIEDGSKEAGEEAEAEKKKDGGEEGEEEAETATASGPASTVVYTLFITNIPFTATEDNFHAFLLDTCARLAKAPDTLIKRLVFQQQQGRVYLTLADAATYRYCLGRLNGRTFDGRALSCVPSKQTELGTLAQASGTTAVGGAAADDETGGVHGDDAHLRKAGGPAVAGSSDNSNTAVPRGCDPYKLVVKNVPFEATEADLRELFSAFSDIKSVRLPKKSNHFTKHRENNHRGFAFVEFLSESEAARAMGVLKATHLYGRHLVLQYAKLDG